MAGFDDAKKRAELKGAANKIKNAVNVRSALEASLKKIGSDKELA